MSFMEPQITRRAKWVRVEWREGTSWVEAEYFDPRNWDGITETEDVLGHGARLSAPGYMDATEWVVFNSIAEAASHLLDTYYDQPDDELTEDERMEREWLERMTNDPVCQS